MARDYSAIRQGLEERIRAAAERGGDRNRPVRVVAVSKMTTLEEVQLAWQSGFEEFGENRVQELVAKHAELPEARWHLIGRLQTNKVKDAIERSCLIHSLDRWPLAEYIEKRAQILGRQVDTLLEVNISGEKTKAGVTPEDVVHFLSSLSEMRYLRVLGLMTVAPEEKNPEKLRSLFKQMKHLFDSIRGECYPNVEMVHLSMGMSGDFEVAVEEGANIVRIGRAVFG